MDLIKIHLDIYKIIKDIYNIQSNFLLILNDIINRHLYFKILHQDKTNIQMDINNIRMDYDKYHNGMGYICSIIKYNLPY
jgi:hypothetical protein